MKKSKIAIFVFASILIVSVSSYLFANHDSAAAKIILDGQSASGDSGSGDAVLDQEPVGQLLEGENDQDSQQGLVEVSVPLSDDRSLSKYPGVSPGNYVWQSLDEGETGSFGNVNWTAGYEFVPQIDEAVTELCGFFDDSVREVDLYDQSFGLLATATIKSDGGWTCVSIDPVDVEKKQTYYVVSKIENEPLYYKYRCCNPSLLPQTVSNVKITAGVRQVNGEKFGVGLKRYNSLVFGLVDVKISKRGLPYLPASGVRPIIIDPEPTGTISNSKPLLSVATDKNTTCKYAKTKKNYADMDYTFTATGGKTHTKRIGVLADGSYTRYVRCKDGDGNISYATKISFIVKNGSTSNISKPVISNPQPTGTISDNTPTISVATDENATCKYSAKNVSYNSLSRVVFSTTGGVAHSATLGALNDGSYTYYVRCKDEAGNANISSVKIIFTVASNTGDTTPPVISNVAVSPASGTVGDNFTITAKVTDASGISGVQTKIQHPDGTTISTATMKDDGNHGDGAANDNIYGVVWSSIGKDAGDYFVDIAATDKYGNSANKNNGATFTVATSGGDDDNVDSSCVPLLKSGSSADKIDIVFVPANYGSDMVTFEADAKKHMDAIFNAAPLSDYKSYFNIWMVKQTGLTCNSNLCTALSSVVNFKTLAAKCNADTTAILAVVSGGSFGGCTDISNGVAIIMSSFSKATPHEMGHAVFKLWDEYVYSAAYTSGEFDDSYWCGSNAQVDFANAPNCDKSSTCSKWSGISGVSCSKGCTCPNDYRAASSCMMNDYGPFCKACSAQIAKIIKNYK